MTSAARCAFVEGWNCFCKAGNGSEDLPFEARHTENAIRISLALHAFSHVEINQTGAGTFNARMRGHEHPLHEQTARKALQIRDWFSRQVELRMPQRAAVDDQAVENRKDAA